MPHDRARPPRLTLSDGAVSGLPLAAQLIGAHGDDLATLGAARLLAAEGLVPPTLRAPETA